MPADEPHQDTCTCQAFEQCCLDAHATQLPALPLRLNPALEASRHARGTSRSEEWSIASVCLLIMRVLTDSPNSGGRNACKGLVNTCHSVTDKFSSSSKNFQQVSPMPT